MENNQVTVPTYLKIGKVLAWLMYAWVFIGIILLSLRTFLLAFSANPTTPFVEFIYRTSADYLQPFRGVFPSKSVGETGYLDVAALFAIIIYLLLAWAFSALVHYIQSKIDAAQAQGDEPAQAARRTSAKR